MDWQADRETTVEVTNTHPCIQTTRGWACSWTNGLNDGLRDGLIGYQADGRIDR